MREGGAGAPIFRSRLQNKYYKKSKFIFIFWCTLHFVNSNMFYIQRKTLFKERFQDLLIKQSKCCNSINAWLYQGIYRVSSTRLYLGIYTGCPTPDFIPGYLQGTITRLYQGIYRVSNTRLYLGIYRVSNTRLYPGIYRVS